MVREEESRNDGNVKTVKMDISLETVDHSSVFSAFSTIQGFSLKSGLFPGVKTSPNSETGINPGVRKAGPGPMGGPFRTLTTVLTWAGNINQQ